MSENPFNCSEHCTAEKHIPVKKDENMADYPEESSESKARYAVVSPITSKLAESSLEEELNLLETYVHELHRTMSLIKETRQRIFSKRNKANEQEEKLGAAIYHALHSDDNEAVTDNRVRL